MSKKGEQKKTKALSAPRSVSGSRKENVWTVRTKAGTHKRDSSVALGIILRNIIKIAKNAKEARKILNLGEVQVDGIVRKDPQFSMGLFDTIDIDKQDIHYRAMIDKKGRITVKELKKKSNEKLCKVIHKGITKKGIQLTTHDGKNFLGTKANVGDTLIIDLKKGKIKEVIELKEGALIFMIKGKHCAEKGKVKEIVPGTVRRKKLVKLENDKKEYETIVENIFVIGEKGTALDELK